MSIPASYELYSRSVWESDKLDHLQAEHTAERYRAMIGKDILSCTYVYRITAVEIEATKDGKQRVRLSIDDYKLRLDGNSIGVHELRGMFQGKPAELVEGKQ